MAIHRDVTHVDSRVRNQMLALTDISVGTRGDDHLGG